MQIQKRILIPKERPDSEYLRSLEEELVNYSIDLSKLLNNGLKLSDNLSGQIKSYTSNGVADTEDTVAHTIKRIPSGIIVLHQDKAGSLYQGPTTGTNWTASNVYLKCDVASVTFSILII